MDKVLLEAAEEHDPDWYLMSRAEQLGVSREWLAAKKAEQGR